MTLLLKRVRYTMKWKEWVVGLAGMLIVGLLLNLTQDVSNIHARIDRHLEQHDRHIVELHAKK